MSDSNGAAERRPKYGERPNQQLHPDTADELLTLWFERSQAGGVTDFGALLAEVLTGGVRYSRKRGQ